MTKLLFLISLVVLLNGCAVFNPYSSDFTCPDSFAGKCISVQGAYAESVEGKDQSAGEKVASKSGSSGEEEHVDRQDDKDKTKPVKNTIEARNYNAYRSSLYQKFDTLLKEPETPMVAPPKVMRVLLLPYKGQENELFAMRHVYIFVDEPRWILGDSIQALEEAD